MSEFLEFQGVSKRFGTVQGGLSPKDVEFRFENNWDFLKKYKTQIV